MNFSGNMKQYFPVEESSGAEGADGPKTNILLEIFGRLWAIWGLILFVVTMLLFMIPFLLFSYFQPDPQKTRRFVIYSRVWMRIYLTGIGCPLYIKGKEKFRKGENYVVVFNHNSLMDVPISSPGVPGANKTIAKTSFAKVPLFGMLYRTGSVLVDRKSEASRRDSFIKMKEVLDMGMHMTLYPEGTRNLTSQPLKSFHNGAFRLSLTAGKAIMPAIIFHSKYVLPANKPFFLRPHRLVMHFLDPVTPLPGESVDELRERVFRIMSDYYQAGGRAGY